MAKHIEEYEWNGEGSYILEGQTPKGWVCLDATRRMGSVGHLLNHSPNPNLKLGQYLCFYYRLVIIDWCWDVVLLSWLHVPWVTSPTE